jgi:hypothetical protein
MRRAIDTLGDAQDRQHDFQKNPQNQNTHEK